MKMLKKIWVLWICIFPAAFSFAQPNLPIVWQEVFGGNKQDGVGIDGTYANFASLDNWSVRQHELQIDDSGNVYILVSSNSGIGGNKSSSHCGVQSKTDVWLVKLNPQGQKLWEVNIGSDNRDYPQCLVLDTINRFIYMVGSSKSVQSSCQISDTSHGQTDVWIVKLDWSGNVLWSHLYGGPNKELPVAAALYSNGHLFVVSASESINGGGDISSSITSAFGDNAWIMSVNPQGQLDWDRWMGSDICEIKMFDATPFGNYVVAVGYLTGSVPNRDVTYGVHYDPQLPGWSGVDGWVIMLDTNGTRIWDRTLGGYNSNEYLQSASNGFGRMYLSGHTNTQIQSGDITDTLKGTANSFWYVTLDSLGNKVNDKIKSSSIESGGGYDLEFCNGLIYSLGWAGDSGLDNWDTTGGYWLMAMDTSFQLLWSTCVTADYGSNGMLPAIHPTPDSGLVFVTSVNDTTFGEFTLPVFDTVNHTSDIWVLKLNPFNTTTGIAETPISGKAIHCYPNPATTGITVSGLRPSDLITVQDLSGRNVKQMHLSGTDTSSFVPLSSLLPGLYLIRTTDGVCKVVKQ